MHNIISDKPYTFFPPHESQNWPKFLRLFSRLRLKRKFGILKVETQGLEKLSAILNSGDGVIIAPNHCHPADPFVVIDVLKQVDTSPYIMASWHLFLQSKLQAFLLRRGGVFSVYREGIDRQALSSAIDILVESRRPLVIFPEGVISRHNDFLNPIQEGIEFIAKNALKKKIKTNSDKKVFVVPFALKYVFEGDLNKSVDQVLTKIENQLSWKPFSADSISERILRIGNALLSLKEIEYLGEAQQGILSDRVTNLINKILFPIEQEWLKDPPVTGVVARVKKLRMKILPDMVEGKCDENEKKRRWKMFEDLYLAQTLHCFPPNYIKDNPTTDRMLETIERFEEALTDKTTIHSPRKVIVKILDPIDVSSLSNESNSESLSKVLEKSISASL